MSESLIIFCREWAVTVALTGYLTPVYPRPVMPVHGLAQLTRILQAYPRRPVLLGLRPHEHVVDLYRELSATGLTGYEVRVLSLMTEGRNGNLPSRTRSLHKNNGLYKLGMTKHLTDLYRGVKVRAALQSGLRLQAEDTSPETENIIPLRQEAGR